MSAVARSRSSRHWMSMRYVRFNRERFATACLTVSTIENHPCPRILKHRRNHRVPPRDRREHGGHLCEFDTDLRRRAWAPGAFFLTRASSWPMIECCIHCRLVANQRRVRAHFPVQGPSHATEAALRSSTESRLAQYCLAHRGTILAVLMRCDILLWQASIRECTPQILAGPCGAIVGVFGRNPLRK